MTLCSLRGYIKLCVLKSMQNKIPLGLSYDDVLLIPQHSNLESRSEVDLSTQITPNVKIKLPLISINMTDVTGVEMAITIGKMGGLGFLPRFVSINEQAKMVKNVKKAKVKVGAAIGIKNGEFDRALALVKAGADIITLDIAHGGMQKAIDMTSKLKSTFGKKVDIISGVVATYESADDLFKAGADCVRVGVGPGTICITRIVTGIGVPQISALIECKKAAEKHKKTILCDGGTTNSGHIMKGLAAGGSAVVIGSQFAGAKESPGEIITIKGKKLKAYNASTSLAEKKNHKSKLKDITPYYLKHIEGVESYVEYKGELKEIINRMEANLRAGFSYCGSKTIKELWQKAKFIRISQAGYFESSYHGVMAKRI